jgi:chromosome segregation ATPase
LGGIISQQESTDADARSYGFDRLEHAVEELAASHASTVARNRELIGESEAKSQRIRSLEEQLLVANQRRQDVAKYIDELIAQIDQLDVQLQALDEAQ